MPALGRANPLNVLRRCYKGLCFYGCRERRTALPCKHCCYSCCYKWPRLQKTAAAVDLLTIIIIFLLLFFTPRTAQAAGGRLHNTLGRFQVPELWIPFSSPPCSSSQRLLPAKILSLAIKAAFIWIWESMRAKEKKIIILQKKTGGGGGLYEGGGGADSWSEENKAKFHFLSKPQGRLAYSSFCSQTELSTMSRLTGFEPDCGCFLLFLGRVSLDYAFFFFSFFLFTKTTLHASSTACGCFWGSNGSRWGWRGEASPIDVYWLFTVFLFLLEFFFFYCIWWSHNLINCSFHRTSSPPPPFQRGRKIQPRLQDPFWRSGENPLAIRSPHWLLTLSYFAIFWQCRNDAQYK